MLSIAAKCLRALSGLFSPNLIDQSACRMSLALACVVIILHDDWSISLGENRRNRGLKHLVAMLPCYSAFSNIEFCYMNHSFFLLISWLGLYFFHVIWLDLLGEY